MNSKILAIILARKNSQRLKQKHLLPLQGKPLIQYTFDYAKSTPLLDDIICSTDCDDIERFAKSCDISVIKRPSAYAKDSSHIIDAIEFTLSCYFKQHGSYPKTTVILYGNVPIRSTRLEDGLEYFYHKNADSLFTAKNVLKNHPDWMFENHPEGKLQLKPNALDYRVQSLPSYFIVTDSFIISKTEVLLNRRPRTHLYSDFGDNLYYMEEKNAMTTDVDDQTDLTYCEFLLSQKKI